MRNIHSVLGLFLFALSLFCSSAGLAETLVIPGSGNPEFVLGRMAEAFNAAQSEHQVSVPSSTGTAGAFRDIESGAATLARVGRPPKGGELDLGLVYLPIGRDPVVFVAGAGVTVSGITSPQAVAIFRGESQDWSELGGAAAPIRAIGRERGDASRGVIMKRLPEFIDITYGGNVKVVHLDPDMVALLDRFPTSIGMLNRSALYACQTRVKPLALDGVEPTSANVADGSYPLWLEFGLIHKAGGLTPAGRAFIAFIQSPAGEIILRDHGVISASATPGDVTPGNVTPGNARPGGITR